MRCRPRIDEHRPSAIRRNCRPCRQPAEALEGVAGLGGTAQEPAGRGCRSLSGRSRIDGSVCSRVNDDQCDLQFYADANEAESWLREKLPLVRSTDYGEDEPSAQALLARHRDLEGQIRAYEGDLQSLNTQADRLVASGVTSLMLNEANPAASEGDAAAKQQPPDDEWTEEIRMVPEEFYEEEAYERTEYRTVTEERLVPQVKGLYAFEGQGMTLAKGEVFNFGICSLPLSSFAGRLAVSHDWRAGGSVRVGPQ